MPLVLSAAKTSGRWSLGLANSFKPGMFCYSKWFEPRSISSSYCVVVQVRVVLKRNVVGHPDNHTKPTIFCYIILNN